MDAPILFEEPLSPRIANYDISVRLDTETRMIRGQQQLTWINKSGGAVTELQFHLYLNGFRNSQTTFLRESGGRMRGAALDDDGWGFIEIDRIHLPLSTPDLVERLDRYASPLPGMGSSRIDAGSTDAGSTNAGSTMVDLAGGGRPLRQILWLSLP